MAERFFWSLKHEWTNHEKFDNLEAARRPVFKYIEAFYNTTRMHETLGYLAPNECEAQFQQRKEQAATRSNPARSVKTNPDHAPV